MRTSLLLAATLAAASACSKGAPDASGGPVKITVTENGYEPPTVLAKAGQPLTLVVTRTAERTCATEFFLPEHDLNVPLPLNQPVTITFTPKQAGKLRYSCAMRMFFGDIDVR